MKPKSTDEMECCPKFDPAPWDGKTFEWNEKKFIKGSVFTLFYMPVNFGKIMRKLDKTVRKSKGEIMDNMGLSDHTSKWNMDIYLAVNNEIPGAKNISLSGNFASRLYDVPYKETGNWNKDFMAWYRKQNFKPLKYFMWYTTCPKCAKKYGKNYVVYMAEIEP